MMPRFKILLVLLLVSLSVQVSGAQDIGSFAAFTLALRSDLDLLADSSLGPGVRPDDWTNNIDNTSPTYVADVWFDSELLANELFGEGERPANWRLLRSDRPNVILRETRVNTEIMADDVFGVETRPNGWSGAAPIFACDRTLQNAFGVLQTFYSFAAPQDDAFGFCTVVGAAVEAAPIELAYDEPLTTEESVDQLLLAVRGDLERIANEVFGLNDRPGNWTGNNDITSALLASDNYTDIETLADSTLGEGQRPVGWLGLPTAEKATSFRNQRRDLELLANAVVPTLETVEGFRPRGWQGLEYPFRGCPVLVQSLALALEVNYAEENANFPLEEIEFNFAYCATLEDRANLFAEDPPLSDAEQLALERGDTIFDAESEIAFAYLDPSALEYMGIMPAGVRFRAWYRNFGESTMMFVQGEDFALFVDRRFTTLPQDVFDRLPTTEGVAPLTFCDASWCNGPGPTPTPTGNALGSVLALATPQAPPDPEEVGGSLEEKTEVGLLNVRITYLQDNTATRSAQIVLEICEEEQQITCEPVISVFDNSLGAPRPVISEFQGQNVYEFQYGLTQNVVIESETLFTNSIFVSDPTQPRE